MPKFECIARGAFHGGERAIGDVVTVDNDADGNPPQMPKTHWKLQGTDTPPPKGVSGEVRDVAPDAINRRLGSEQFVDPRTKEQIKADEAKAKSDAEAAAAKAKAAAVEKADAEVKAAQAKAAAAKK